MSTAKNVEELIESAERGEMDAIVDLGMYYLYKSDPEYGKAFALLQDAALAGVGEAQLHLGKMYENGWYVDSDLWSAINLYRLAFKSRTPKARKALGEAYEKVCESIEVTGKPSVNENFEIEACCDRFLDGIRMGRIMPKDDGDKVSFYLVNFSSETPIDECVYCGKRFTHS